MNFIKTFYFVISPLNIYVSYINVRKKWLKIPFYIGFLILIRKRPSATRNNYTRQRGRK